MNIIVLEDIDLIHEANVILAHIAENFSYEEVLESLTSRYQIASTKVEEKVKQVSEIYNQILNDLTINRDRITYFYKSIGTYSDNLASFVLLNDQIIYNESIDDIKKRVLNSSEEMRIKEFSKRLDGFSKLAIEDEDTGCATILDLFQKINTFDMDNESKLVIQQIFMNKEFYLNEVIDILKETINLIKSKQTEIKILTQEFFIYWNEFINKYDIQELLKEKANISFDYNKKGIIIIPNFFNCIKGELSTDSLNVMENEKKPYLYRIGIAVEEQFLQSNAEPNLSTINQTLKLLSDKSKFEILMLIKNQKEYGSELAKKLDLSTPTISYHMSALLQAGLVKLEKENNRFYYSTHKKTVEEFLDIVRKLLIE